MSEPKPSDDSRTSDEMMRLLYEELRRQAERQMRSERTGHTLSATALVHEAWMRVGERPGGWASRAEFYFAATKAMRRILIENARSRGRAKRGGDWKRVTLGTESMETEIDPTDLLALEEALERLAAESPRSARVVQLCFFAGLNVAEVAELLEVSEPTVRRDLEFARAYLGEFLLFGEEPTSNGPR
ncbi:MAG: sigma-70 family RNA polymerase sigma factor [bacterium]|nr:sigma-70 family RNA polymerase sigma factor [bacterium]